jgi:hypothetical protein
MLPQVRTSRRPGRRPAIGTKRVLLKHRSATLPTGDCPRAASPVIRGLSRQWFAEASSGGRTKFNRSRLGIPNTHALEAACVGEVGALVGWQQPTFRNQGERKKGLLPDQLTAQFASRLPRAHHVRSRLPNRRHGASQGACRGSWQRLFRSGQCRRNQHGRL